ncbi:hypothetical protein BDZ89DRAFT_1127106 [Hymenopellis radicata]|nr:hypothetical protein BDZ89DRAFT_1127106 [Hymenopellis radicata]
MSAAPTSQLGYNIPVFDSLLVAGFLLLLATLIVAALSQQVRRSKTWFSFLGAALVWSLTYLVLLGQQFGRAPSYGLCVFQTCLIYAVPPLTATAGLCMVVELYMRVSCAVFEKAVNERVVWFIANALQLVLLPPVVHLAVFIEASAVALAHRQLVSREDFGLYCHLDSSTSIDVALPSKTSAIVSMVATSMAALFLGYIVYLLVYHGRKSSLYTEGMTHAFSVSLFIRTALLILISMVGVALAAVSWTRDGANSNPPATWSILMACVPLCVAVLFGTQKDIMNGCLFWRNRGGFVKF